MIVKETWNIRSDCDKIEKLIKYNIHVQYKKCLKNSQVTQNNPLFFFLWMIAFFNTMN